MHIKPLAISSRDVGSAARVLAGLLLALLLPLAAHGQSTTQGNTSSGGNAPGQQCTGKGSTHGSVSISATSLAFGTYNPASTTPTLSTFTVTAMCSGGQSGETLPALTIALSAGSSGSFAQRLMTQAGSSLKYQIYTSPVGPTAPVWGDGTGGTVTVSGGNSGTASQAFTGYGGILAAQYTAPGTYTDTIIVTVTY